MNFEHVTTRQDDLHAWPEPANIIASWDHHCNGVASPRVINTVATLSSTDQLAHKNRITEKTFSYAVKQAIKTVRNSPVVNGRHFHIDISLVKHCWRADVAVDKRTIVRNRIPLEPTLFDHKCSFA
jgi:hypothetical protein